MEEKTNIRVVDTQTWDNSFSVTKEYTIESEESYEGVLQYCLENIRSKELERNEYLEAYQKASAKMDFNEMMRIDANGWYTLEQVGDNYVFETQYKKIK